MLFVTALSVLICIHTKHILKMSRNTVEPKTLFALACVCFVRVAIGRIRDLEPVEVDLTGLIQPSFFFPFFFRFLFRGSLSSKMHELNFALSGVVFSR